MVAFGHVTLFVAPGKTGKGNVTARHSLTPPRRAASPETWHAGHIRVSSDPADRT